ncbi:MAG TPA: transcription termination factor NusA, partial [Planctomycetia bacterium]|nr:transcription termination factor NusA [Planctomycetia bacterium]
RASGTITATHDGEVIDADSLGRIAAQMAKQIIIQKIREAERDRIFEEYIGEKGTIVRGVIQRNEGGVVTVTIGKAEAILPRSEQMPGESYISGAPVRALLLDVRKNGQRVKLVLSRAHPDFVRQLFDQEIPEVMERIIEIRAIAREAGHRTKVAVSSIDSRVDCVGACVGVRGSRIKTILDELEGERIDIIRYNESLQTLIPNALLPAQVDDVQIYPRTGRAIVLVKEDQLSLAIGKRGQNVRLASRLAGIDIEIMTPDELDAAIDKAKADLIQISNLDEEMVEALIEEGILSFDDLSVTEPDVLMEMTGLEEQEVAEMVEAAEIKAEEQAPEQSSRSLVVGGQPSRPSAAMRAAEQLLGAAEPQEAKPVEAPRTAADIFGDVEVPAKREQKISAEELFKNIPSGESPPQKEDEP